LSQQSAQANGAYYDSAAVMLETPADKVYAAVLGGVCNAQGIRITREDAGARLVQFTNGGQTLGHPVAPCRRSAPLSLDQGLTLADRRGQTLDCPAFTR